MFDKLDANGNGQVSRGEFIKGIRNGTGVHAVFGLSTTVRQEDGTRDAFERVFQELDHNGDKTLTRQEFLAAVHRLEAERGGERGGELGGDLDRARSAAMEHRTSLAALTWER